MTTDNANYVEQQLPPEIVEKLEAGAFRRLCTHLKERSDSVQNMDLMTVSGFCRNCLAKWMVVEARRLSETLKDSLNDEHDINRILQALDAMGYDEAAQYVYGCNYEDWKKRHAKKATDEQMQRYNDSKPIHAVHDKDLLAARADKPSKLSISSATGKIDVTSNDGAASASTSLLSNVCCQDVDESVNAKLQPIAAPAKKSRTLSAFQPPGPPTNGVSFQLGILTVSDRAFANQYETGDLSGPAVEESVLSVVRSMGDDSKVTCSIVKKAIVPDETEQIQKILKEWCSDGCDLILTTGGTGFGKKDVTPEATIGILDRECRGLLSFVTTECAQQHQPLASLSRGSAGICGSSIIANLPGNPKGVGEIIPILLPVLLHAIFDLQHT